MKNTIKLNEDTFHRLIEGCVKEALNELHPITYANVARARKKQVEGMKDSEWDEDWDGAMKKQRNLFRKVGNANSMARNAWNKEYGYQAYASPGDNAKTFKSYKMDGNDSPQVHYFTDRVNGWPEEDKYKRNTYYPNGGKMDRIHGRNGVFVERNKPYNPIDDPNAEEGDKVAYYMQNGGAKYVPGKGYEI